MKNKLLTILLTASAIAAFPACTEQEQAPLTVKVESISINQYDLSLKEGESTTLKATILPADATNKTVTWSSTNASVASVDANGQVTANSEGSATITATADGKSASCLVTVSKNIIHVTEVTLNKATLELKEGESFTLIATVLPNEATYKTVAWSSTNGSVASVNANGQVTANAEGSASITATADGQSAVCSVIVSRNNPGGGQEGTSEENWD